MWFNENDTIRVNNITEVLFALNADIFVFQEVRQGSLDGVAQTK